MPVALVRLYVDNELRRTDAMQVAEEPDSSESFFNLFKRQEPSTSLVLSKVLAVGPDGTGGKMKIEVQPGTIASSVIFSRQNFPHGNASVEFYAASSSLSKNDKVLVSPPKVVVSRKEEEEGEEGELEESNDPRSKHYTGSSSSSGVGGALPTQQTGAAQIQALAEQKRKTNLKGPFIILQFGIKPYYSQADYFVGSYTLYQKLHQNRLDANAATIFDRKMSEDLFESDFPPLEDTTTGLQSDNACAIAIYPTTIEFHPTISVHLDSTGLQSSVKLDQSTTVRVILFRKSSFLQGDLQRYIKRYDKRKDKVDFIVVL